MPKHYDLIVIGGGSGGLTAAIMGARLGARVLLVDRESLGGDCLHYGCVPSKALIASARVAHQMRHADRYGLAATPVNADVRQVMARIVRIQQTIGQHETPDALRQLGVDVALGGAQFVDDKTVQTGDSGAATGEQILIATGSHAVTPELPGLAEAGYLNNENLFGMTDLPRRLVVIGGGPVGSEMGQALSRLGADVTILQRAPRLLAREDPEISQVLQTAFEAEGIALRLRADVVRVSANAGAKRVAVDRGGQQEEIECDQILVAVGRKPTLDGLNLSAAGIETTARGIVVNDALQTNRPHVYAVGDCNGGPQFTHWAEYEARIATRNALFHGQAKRSKAAIPWVTFCDPEVARVGKTRAEAEQERPKGGVHEHTFPYDRLDRAICESAPEGLAKVVVDDKDRVLGAHLIGIHAGEALAEWVTAIEHNLPLSAVGKAIHVYPTLGRINRRLADESFFTHGVSRLTTKLFGRFKARAQPS